MPQLARLVRPASPAAYNTAMTTLKKDLKQAMISKDDLKKNTIRGLLSAIKNKEIDNKDGDLDEFTLFDIYSKLINQRKDSINGCLENGREDLVSKERQESELIEGYLNGLPIASQEEIDSKALQYLKKLKNAEPNLQMKQVFGKVDWNTISAEWKASPKSIKSSLASQYKKAFSN